MKLCALHINIWLSAVVEASWIKAQLFSSDPLYLYHLHSLSVEHLKNTSQMIFFSLEGLSDVTRAQIGNDLKLHTITSPFVMKVFETEQEILFWDTALTELSIRLNFYLIRLIKSWTTKSLFFLYYIWSIWLFGWLCIFNVGVWRARTPDWHENNFVMVVKEKMILKFSQNFLSKTTTK